MNLKHLFAAFCLCFFFSLQLKAKVWYVDSAAVNITANQNGATWDSAYKNPQLAINAALSGDSVWIARGTYTALLNTPFIMKEGVKIFGGFLNSDTTFAQRNYQTHVTVLKGNGSSVIYNNANNLTNAALIDGVTIRNGNNSSNGYGGGMYNYNSSPGIRNCTFSSNTASGGGAIYNKNGSAPGINNCIFSSNSAFSGGAIYNDSSSSPGITNCTFNSNTAESYGGAIYNKDSTFSAIISYCTFNNNISSAGFGGAVYASGKNIAISNCTFNNNRANAASGVNGPNNAYGGAIYASGNNTAISYCTFNNSKVYSLSDYWTNTTYASAYGGAIYASGNNMSISNCGFKNNTSVASSESMWNTTYTTSYGGAIYISGNNNIVSNNTFENSSSFAEYDYYYAYNYARSYGGAIYVSGNSTSLNNCTFIASSSTSHAEGYCTASSFGGAVYNASSLTINNCAFKASSSAAVSDYPSFSSGGAIFNAATLTISNSTFNNNTAIASVSPSSTAYGGAIYNDYASTLTLSSCLFNASSVTSAYSSSGNLGSKSCHGGAIYNKAILNASRCIFNNSTASATTAAAPTIGSGTTATAHGGAIYSTAKIDVSNCAFSNSTVTATVTGTASAPIIATAYGGAIYNELTTGSSLRTISNCSFTNNAAFYGGAIYNNKAYGTVNTQNCTFSGNAATNGSGGAICNNGMYSTNAVLSTRNCTFTGNKASSSGGGMYSYSIVAGIIKVANCTFSADSAQYGAGIYDTNASPVIVNCLFAQNIATISGAALYNTGSISIGASRPEVVNCTMVQNRAGTNGSGIYNTSYAVADVSNTIIWGNSSGIYNAATSSINTKYSLIQGYPASAASFLIDGTTDPLFIDTAGGNYQLQSTSPCVNAGRNDSIPSGIITDLASHARIYNTTVDMGAYEFGVFAPVVNLGFDTAVCAGNTVTLNAQNAGATYVWNTGATTQTIDVTASGTYYVTATNNIGSSSDTIVVTVNPLPVVNLGNDTVMCNGSAVSITLDAQNLGATYLWNNNNTYQTINATTSGTYFVSVTNAYQCSKNDTIIIVTGIPPTVNLGNDTAFCAGNTLTLNAQNAGATYLWSNTATTQTTGITASGTYYVTVTAANQCKRSDTIQVTVKPLPVVNLGNDTAFCADNSLTLNAQNAGAAYLWNNAATTQTISANTAGTYYVTVTGANLCKGSDTIHVTVNALPIVTLGNDTTICAGNSLTLNAQNAGSTYTWSNASTAQTLNVASAGTYYVTVINANSCKGRDTIQVNVASLPVVNLGNDTAFCIGNTLTLNAQNTGSTYIWNNAATTQTIGAASTGSYYVTVTNTNLCKGSDTIHVTVNALPIVNLGNDTTICAGNSLTLNAQNAGSTYLWSNAATSQAINVNTTGTYNVTVTNANNCKGSDTLHLTISSLPVVNLGNDTTLCAGSYLTLNAQNTGSTYLWSNAATSQTINVNTAGTYNVTVTNADNCKGSDTIHLTASALPVVNLGNDTAFCAGSYLTLNAQNAGAAYLWSTGSSAQTINVNATGIYGVGVTDINGCKGSDTIQVTANPVPIVNLGTDVTINANSYTINAGNAGSTYLWNTGATTQTLTVTTNGTYSVTVTNANDCSTSDTIKVTFEPIGIKDVNIPGHLVKVIPNPAKDIIYIQTYDDKLINQLAVLTDAYGRVLRTITIKSKSQELSLDNLAQGMYFLKIQTGETLKIVKE
ncbi:T9SS type A sorting domain-containing protein [Taibaiella lutea]|uniref:T9SS type A sorting domain-containing protein n=1 Tax=Taibaiella lutea TaxID=2608001 RepID=A0A5M6CN84_9BACT|nr:T9SS type A sorting domain-containing protein [Taibaiella lutea]KAA5536678.1 T9SS type A sorting domain-containing protein [Taibaiella lutea]